MTVPSTVEPSTLVGLDPERDRVVEGRNRIGAKQGRREAEEKTFSPVTARPEWFKSISIAIADLLL